MSRPCPPSGHRHGRVEVPTVQQAGNHRSRRHLDTAVSWCSKHRRRRIVQLCWKQGAHPDTVDGTNNARTPGRGSRRRGPVSRAARTASRGGWRSPCVPGTHGTPPRPGAPACPAFIQRGSKVSTAISSMPLTAVQSFKHAQKPKTALHWHSTEAPWWDHRRAFCTVAVLPRWGRASAAVDVGAVNATTLDKHTSPSGQPSGAHAPATRRTPAARCMLCAGGRRAVGRWLGAGCPVSRWRWQRAVLLGLLVCLVVRSEPLLCRGTCPGQRVLARLSVSGSTTFKLKR